MPSVSAINYVRFHAADSCLRLQFSFRVMLFMHYMLVGIGVRYLGPSLFDPMVKVL